MTKRQRANKKTKFTEETLDFICFNEVSTTAVVVVVVPDANAPLQLLWDN